MYISIYLTRNRLTGHEKGSNRLRACNIQAEIKFMKFRARCS